jgi:hypothetical protein
MLSALGRRRLLSACGRIEKAREGLGALLLVTQPAGRARNLGGAESQGGIRLGFWLNPKAHVRDLRDEQSPEAAMRRFGVVSNRVRVTALERAYGVPGGEKPRRVNPMSGSGMK